MNYREYKEQRQKEFNALPIHFAFSTDRFREEMEAMGLTEGDTDQIIAVGGGGFMKKEDEHLLDEFLESDHLKDLMEEDPKFAEDAFYYEMANHEYHINWQGDWDVVSCFGSVKYEEYTGGMTYLCRMGYSESVMRAYEQARKRFLRDAEEHDWY